MTPAGGALRPRNSASAFCPTDCLYLGRAFSSKDLQQQGEGLGVCVGSMARFGGQLPIFEVCSSGAEIVGFGVGAAPFRTEWALSPDPTSRPIRASPASTTPSFTVCRWALDQNPPKWTAPRLRVPAVTRRQCQMHRTYNGHFWPF